MGSGRGGKQHLQCAPRNGMSRRARIGSWIWISPRSRQLGHPDGEDRASDPRQAGVETDREVSAGGGHAERSGGAERGRYAARRPLSPLLANSYLDALARELERRKHSFCGYADVCNIYVGSRRAAERVKESIQGMDRKATAATGERHQERGREDMGTQVSGIPTEPPATDRSGTESLERYKTRVREKWRSCQSLTSNQLRDAWRQFIRGWWGYYQLAENRRPIYELEGWIRRHIRKCFWLRWHSPKGRERHLRSLGLTGRMLKVAQSSRGAWRLAGNGSLQSALSNARLKRHGFLMPSDLAGY